MRQMIKWALPIMTLLMTAACDEDAEKYVIRGLDAQTALQTGLNTDATEVKITEENIEQNVLTLQWKSLDMTTDGAYGVADNQLTSKLQVSLDESFTKIVEENTNGLSTKSLSGTLLNKMIVGLGAKAGETADIHMRLALSLGANADVYYSNVVSIKVTPFMVIMNQLDAYNSAKTDILFSLMSEESNGVYEGFSAVSAWLNCYFVEKDGTEWGNVGSDGNYFKISNEETKWNIWYPGTGGFYHTIVDTKQKTVEATLISKMTIGGDVSAEMTFDKSLVQWTGTITTTSDNAKISICGTGSKYTTSDSEPTGEESIYFSMDGDSILSVSDANSSITIGKAGTYTITMNFADAKTYKMKISNGTPAPAPTTDDKEELPESVDILDADQTASLATLTKTTDGVYVGKISVTSWLNFYVSASKADGSKIIFGSAPEDQYALSSADDCYKCWFNDDNGEAVITIDLKNKKWSYVMGGDEPSEPTIASVTIIDQDQSATLASLSNTGEGVYAGEISVTSWLNFYVAVTLSDGTKTIYGSDPADQYALSNASDCYKCWFNDDNGTGTITIDLNKNEWSYVINADKPAESASASVTILDKDQSATLATMTQTGDGVYSGTISVTSWLNFFVSVTNGDGTKTIYGSDPADQYTLSSASDCYKCWFNDDNGEATLTIDLNTKKWSYKMN